MICEGNNAIWFGEGYGCADNTSINKTACEAVPKTWRSCSDDGTIDNQAKCLNSSQHWYGDFTLGCENHNYTNKTSCEDSSQGNSTWHMCTNNSSTTQLSCEEAGAIWLAEGFGCETQTYLTQATCEANNKLWFKEWSRCKNTTITPNTESFIPFYFAKNNSSSCDVSGTWKYAEQKICMVLFYRKSSDSTIEKLTSDADSSTTTFEANIVIEDGENQTIHFGYTDFNNQTDCENNQGKWEVSATPKCRYKIPTGTNAIGIYEYTDNNNNGTYCEPGDDSFYPADRKDPLRTMFISRSQLPVLNW